ncbi:serine protease [Nonomuraea sp. NPDC050783]|uniref:trypsin-like serine peptidase n=1 Tax=Nonomuraea sp. NPDC050783 TaxID=3154634 RepID=UPI0034665F8D
MTLSTPLLAAAPLLAGLMGPALIGAAAPGPWQAAPAPAGPPVHHYQTRRPAAGPLAGRTSSGPASPPPGPASGHVVEHVAARTTAEQRRVLDYWTPERMANALPIGLLDLVTGGDLLGGLTGRPRPAAAFPRLGAVPVVPALAASAPRGPQAARAPRSGTVGARWGAGGAVARTTGRVFMTVNGADFVCSASTVRSASRDVVVTAGHCVKDGTGQWAQNWTFVPGYGTRGSHPYGRYAARRMFVTGPWARRADDDYDIGMVALATWGGRHVTDVVGGQDIAFNAPRGGQAYGFGYPADPPYRGDRLVYCAGRLRDDPYKQSRDQGLGCAMTAGSSGGPWLTGFDPASGRGRITSLSSFKYTDDPRTMYGPYFGAIARALFDTARRG